MKPSRYLEKFLNLASSAREHYQLVGDFLLVEKLPEDELRTKSGLYIPVSKNQLNTFSTDRPHWVRVLACGEGYYSQEEDPETGTIVEKTVPLDVNPGDIVLVSQVSVKYFSVFGDLDGYEADSIGLTKQSEIQLRFKGEEGYRVAFGSLNKATETTVVG